MGVRWSWEGVRGVRWSWKGVRGVRWSWEGVMPRGAALAAHIVETNAEEARSKSVVVMPTYISYCIYTTSHAPHISPPYTLTSSHLSSSHPHISPPHTLTSPLLTSPLLTSSHLSSSHSSQYSPLVVASRLAPTRPHSFPWLALQSSVQWLRWPSEDDQVQS